VKDYPFIFRRYPFSLHDLIAGDLSERAVLSDGRELANSQGIFRSSLAIAIGNEYIAV